VPRVVFGAPPPPKISVNRENTWPGVFPIYR
jgi:hypothetical protein